MSIQKDMDYTCVDATLSAWNLRRVNMQGDGNCLFSFIAFCVVKQITDRNEALKSRLFALGIPVDDILNVEVIKSI